MEREKGFSLIELMIVVAIGAMLTSIAVPTFQTFISSSHQAEAKAALSAMYIAEEAFFAENTSFTQCLSQAGYAPGGTSRFYSTGYMSPDTVTCGPGGNQTCLAYNWSPITLCDDTCGAFASGNNNATFTETVGASSTVGLINTCANQSAAGVPNSWNANQSNFTVGAAGNISNSGFYDMWQIDNNDKVTNIQSGL